MTRSPEDLDKLGAAILERAQDSNRFIVAIAGPPAAGKSTLAQTLYERLSEQGEQNVVVGMDGFHFDNAVLQEKGLLARKGAPETFDFDGFRVALERIQAADRDVAIPVFDRSMELARAGAAIVRKDTRVILVEGNYLLLDEDPWATLDGLFDFSIYLDVPDDQIRERLLSRWEHIPQGVEKVEHNDLPNAARVRARRRPADLVLR